MTHGLEESHKAESEMSGVSDVSVFQRSKTGLRTGRGPLKLEKGFDLIIIHGIRNNMLEVAVFRKSWVAKRLYSASESLCQANVEPCCRY